MSRGSGSSVVIPGVILLSILLIALPVSAYNVAIYGSNTGFDPALHTGSVSVVRSVPGSAGSNLDSDIDQFTQDSVDVIILGGDATFSQATAAKIEAAVAGGKILVVAYPSNERFDKSLPATNGGVTTGGQYLEVSDPNSVVTKAVFASLPTKFELQGSAPEREQAVANAGTITVLNYDSGMPALLYGKYGKGYVIEWTTAPSPSYMDGATADAINHRMILGLLPEPSATQATTVATPKVTVTPKKTTAAVTQPPTEVSTASPTMTSGDTGEGDIMVYSSPTGASILIDGVYCGTTPKKVSGVPAGNHILRLTMSGYTDYEGSIYIMAGQANQGYGTLQPLSQVTVIQTAAPSTTLTTVATPTTTVAPAPTESQSLLNNSSIIVALIGVITALIAAGASIFTHVVRPPPKKE